MKADEPDESRWEVLRLIEKIIHPDVMPRDAALRFLRTLQNDIADTIRVIRADEAKG